MFKKIVSVLFTILCTAVLAVTVFLLCTKFDVTSFLQNLNFVQNAVEENLHLSEPPEYVLVSNGEQSVKIGMAFSDVTAAFGEPKESFLSEYGFTWHAFHDRYKHYIQIGEQNGTVVAIYTNSPTFSMYGITVGTAKETVEETFGEPLDAIVKGNTKYVMNGIDKLDSGLTLYLKDGQYITVFYDVFKNNSVTSFNIIEYQTEQNFNRLYAPRTTELQKSFERQNFLLTNALRVREGLAPLVFRENIYNAALAHAQDMAMYGYFDHTDLEGGSVSDRAKRSGVHFKTVGENIAMGAQNTLYMHELLMNSEGHRKNILASFHYLGCGVAFAEDDTPYLTQNFYQ